MTPIEVLADLLGRADVLEGVLANSLTLPTLQVSACERDADGLQPPVAGSAPLARVSSHRADALLLPPHHRVTPSAEALGRRPLGLLLKKKHRAVRALINSVISLLNLVHIDTEVRRTQRPDS